MDTTGNAQNAESATAGTLDVNERTRRDETRHDRGDAVTVGHSSQSVPNTEMSGPRSTLEAVSEIGDRPTAVSVGSTHDADRTPLWDAQATATDWVESTLGAWNSTEPLRDAGGRAREEVPGFEIQGELGRGGMGVVYKAKELDLNRLVALKMIRNDWHGNPEHLARFQIEAEAVARLNHPNILRIHRIGQSGPVPYVVLELLEGGTLKERLAGTTLPFREAAALLAALARGVSAAHAAGILHRDLKPSNVLFDQAGVPKIADFGLAKRLDVVDGDTLTGQVLGTPSYMAPEQAKGWDKDIGAAADVYSLGAILYEMLVGRPPIKGSTPVETLKLVQEEDPVSPSRLRSKLPFDLETICLKCIARDPRKRYADAQSLAEDLDRFLDGESILARRTPLWERGVKRARKRPVTLVLVLVGMAAVAIVGEEIWRAQARARLELKKENEKVTALVSKATVALDDAQAASVEKRWDDVRVIVSPILSGMAHETDTRIAPARERAERLQAEAARGIAEQTATQQARDRFRRFVDLRDDALFLDNVRFIEGLENSLEAVCRAARDGLGIFGTATKGDEWTLEALPPALSKEEQREVKTGFFQLLLTLADAVALSPGPTVAERAERALHIVDQVKALDVPATRAYRLRRAAYLEMMGDGEGAARERAEAESVASADAFDLFLMGRESIRKKDWRGAITALEAATHGQQSFFWAHCLLAVCHLQTGEPVAARVGFTDCVERKPGRAWLYMLRGVAITAAARAEMSRRDPDRQKAVPAMFDAAEGDYKRALAIMERQPANPVLRYALLLNRGMMRLLRDDLEAAAADFHEAIRLDRERFEAFADLGQLYQRQGRTDDALEQFGKAIAIKPHWPPLYRSRAHALLGLDDLSPALLKTTVVELEGAIRAVTDERREAAARDLADAIRHALPDEQMIAADLTTQAALHHMAGRHEDALAACDSAIGIAPLYPRAHELRIRVLLDLKRHDDLIRSCNAVLDWATPSAAFYELRGIAKNRIAEHSDAVNDFTRALELCREADRPRLRRLRGWSHVANEAFRSAIPDFDEAVRLAPENADGYLGLGTARANLGQHAEAEENAQNARKFGDESPLFLVRVARIYSLAVRAVILESQKDGYIADRPLRRYQESAVKLVSLALEKTPGEQRVGFFQGTIQKDPAMRPIRRALEAFERNLIDRPAKP